MKANKAKAFYDHPDLSEITSKLLIGISPKEISDWLAAKYSKLEDKSFALPEKSIRLFQSDYLDFYKKIKDDLQIVNDSTINVNTALTETIQGSAQYMKALERYADNEIDIKSMIKRLIVNCEARIETIYELTMQDSANLRPDRVLIEYFNTLANMLEKYDRIIIGAQPNINIENINVQVVDQHLDKIFSIIKTILSNLDIEASELFIEMFNEQIKSLSSTQDHPIVSQTERLAQANIIKQEILPKLNQ